MSTQSKTELPQELSRYRDRLAQVSTADKVAEILRERIAEGDFPPGARLSEESISRGLGVSRNSLREAFRLLVRERLVIHEMNRGVFVRIPSADDVKDMFELRFILETAAIRASVGANLRDVTAAIERGEKAAAEGDWPAVATADLHFHRAVAALLHSERVDELMERLMAELRLAFHSVGAASEFHEPYLRRNRLMADLLCAGDVERAVSELESYLEDARAEIVTASDSLT